MLCIGVSNAYMYTQHIHCVFVGSPSQLQFWNDNNQVGTRVLMQTWRVVKKKTTVTETAIRVTITVRLHAMCHKSSILFL